MDELNNLFIRPFDDCITEFEQLIQDRNKVFLFGAGCSKCAGVPLTSELTEKVLDKLPEAGISKEILSKIIGGFNECDGTQTIEDYMSELVDHIAIAQRRVDKGIKEVKITIDNREYEIMGLKDALNEIKLKIYESIIECPIDISFHRRFIKAIHSTLKAGKPNSKLRTDYIILNYDTFVEDALALESVHYLDGFRGGSIGWWDTSVYDENKLLTKILKPHGSLDWCLLENDTLPKRIRDDKISSILSKIEKYLIWPASTKYRETQLDPYAQVIDLVRKTLRPDLHDQTVLITCGYRFSDTHINVEIENALKESDKNLTLLAFFGEDKPNEILNKWLNDEKINQQVRLHCNKGFYHANKKLESATDLNWWKFEVLTRILEGERA